MNSKSWNSKHWKGLIGYNGVWMILVLILLSGGFSISYYFAGIDKETEKAHERIQVLADMSTIRARLEGLVSSTFNSTLGIVHYTEMEGVINFKLFAGMAEHAVRDSKYISHIAIAPDNVIRWVFPVAGNEGAIGLDYMLNDEQKESVIRVMEERTPLLAGPVNLVQGGVALINRAPVFITNETDAGSYWGVVSIVARMEDLLEDSGVSTSELYSIAIRGRDALGASGEMVWGDPSVFNSEPVIQYVSIPGGYWVIGAIPNKGWSSLSVYSSYIMIIGLGITLLVSLIVILLLTSNYRIDTKNALLAREIEEREAAEEALRKSENKFRGLVEQMNDVVMRITTGGIVTYCSPVIKRVAGLDPEELTGIFVGELAHDFDDVRKIVDGFNSSLSNADSETINFGLKTSNGSIIVAEIVFRLVQFEGNNDSVHCLLRNITAQKSLEMDLVRAKDEAEAANRIKTAFLANMSHEIRTPMNSILGFSDLLLIEEWDVRTLRNYLGIINQSSRRLLNVINDVIDISIIESGQVKIKPAVVNLDALFINIFELHQKSASDKGIELRKPSGKACEGFVSDETRLFQILSNLVGNAIKFTSSGYVEYGCNFDSDGILLFVKDTGIGISKEDQTIIFERFRQAESSAKGIYGGTGLGLAISKSLIEMMNGTISVESDPFKGATFFVKLPSLANPLPSSK